MAVRKIYKSDIVGFDRLEKRYYCRDLFNKLDFECLRKCGENLDKDEFKKLMLSICKPDLGITTLLVLKSFLFDCAKENLFDSVLLIRKVNFYFDKFGW